MSDLALRLEPETPDDAEDIERLNERVFGPGRFARSAYRIRETADADKTLCFVARVGTLLVGANAHDADRHRRRAGAPAWAADRRAGVPQPGNRRSAGDAVARGRQGRRLEARDPGRRRTLLRPDGVRSCTGWANHASRPRRPDAAPLLRTGARGAQGRREARPAAYKAPEKVYPSDTKYSCPAPFCRIVAAFEQ